MIWRWKHKISQKLSRIALTNGFKPFLMPALNFCFFYQYKYKVIEKSNDKRIDSNYTSAMQCFESLYLLLCWVGKLLSLKWYLSNCLQAKNLHYEIFPLNQRIRLVEMRAEHEEVRRKAIEYEVRQLRDQISDLHIRDGASFICSTVWSLHSVWKLA